MTFEALELDATVVTLRGLLRRPVANGRHPAVVLLHGCGGIRPSSSDEWADRLVEWGYVALQIDSFAPRGHVYPTLEELVFACNRHGTTGAWQMAHDAHAAKRFLVSLPFVDADRVAVMGQSHGGTATLLAVQNIPTASPPRWPEPFAAGIALYPGCRPQLHELASPLVVLIGSDDNSTPASRCEHMKAQATPDNDFQLIVYEGAHHAFDVDGPDRVIDHQFMRYDAGAAADAVRRVRLFLRSRFQ